MGVLNGESKLSGRNLLCKFWYSDSHSHDSGCRFHQLAHHIPFPFLPKQYCSDLTFKYYIETSKTQGTLAHPHQCLPLLRTPRLCYASPSSCASRFTPLSSKAHTAYTGIPITTLGTTSIQPSSAPRAQFTRKKCSSSKPQTP